MTSYSSGSGGFSFRLLDNLTYTLRGHVRLFAGGRLTLLEGLLNPFLVALILLLAASVVALCYRLARFAGDLKRLSRLPAWPRTTRRVAALCAAWIVPPLVFCFFFYPSDTFHRLPYLPALVLLFGALLSRLDAARNFPRRARLALFVAALALANFCFYIYPYTHARNNPPLATALRMRDALAPGAVVFVAQSNGDNRLFRYFNRAAEWRTLRAGDFESLEREVREAAAGGREVWLETTAIARLEKLPGGREWLDARRARLTKIELVNDKFDIRYLRVA